MPPPPRYDPGYATVFYIYSSNTSQRREKSETQWVSFRCFGSGRLFMATEYCHNHQPTRPKTLKTGPDAVSDFPRRCVLLLLYIEHHCCALCRRFRVANNVLFNVIHCKYIIFTTTNLPDPKHRTKILTFISLISRESFVFL